MYLTEIPSGTINGTNTIFTTTGTIGILPVIAVNGMIIPPSDTIYGFSFTNNTFTMTTAPLQDDVILIIYNDA